jgi:hypothetical protein
LVNGRRVRRPTHNAGALKAVVSFIKDFDPHQILFGGDQLNLDGISAHNHGKPRLVEGLRISDDYDALADYALDHLDVVSPGSQRIWLTGNHENRVRRYLDANPAGEGFMEPEVYLRLRERNFVLQPEELPYRIGKVHFVHGHACFPRGGCKDPAAKLANFYRRNIRCGHLHQFAAATDITPSDRRDFHSAIVVPALCRVNPGYNNNASDNFQLGFLYGEVTPSGNYNDYVVIIHENKFVVNGKQYHG